MKYGFIAMVEDQEIVSYETQHQVAADALLGALGLDIMASNRTVGDIDVYLFTDAELSAAEAALAVAVNKPPMFDEGLVFLASVRAELARGDMDCCHIEIQY
jgi:hypothetical protein